MTAAEAKRIAALPVAQRGPVLFNRVYGVGNPTKMREFNNTGPNDGWLYRGGGMMQAPGKATTSRCRRRPVCRWLRIPSCCTIPTAPSRPHTWNGRRTAGATTARDPAEST